MGYPYSGGTAGQPGIIAWSADIAAGLNALAAPIPTEEVRFVSSRGSDSTGDGMTARTAFATVTKAITDLAGSPGRIELLYGTVRDNVAAFPPNVHLNGLHPALSVVKGVSGANVDVVKGKDFATLTGKSYASGDILLGARNASITNVGIDGDKANNSAGYGIRMWGCSFYFHHVLVYNCKSGGIWTEFTTHDAGTLNDLLEGSFADIKIQGCDGNGWTYRGPHDSFVSNLVVVSCTGWAFRGESAAGSYNGGSVWGGNWNSWLCGNDFFFTAGTYLVNVAATGGGTGTGIEIAAGAGSVRIFGLVAAGRTTGVISRGTNHVLVGTIQSITGVALQRGSSGGGNSEGGSIYELVGNNVGTLVDNVNVSGPSLVKARFGAPVTTQINGFGGANDSYDVWDATNGAYFGLPSATLNAAGWAPQLPADNGVLVSTTQSANLINKMIGHRRVAQTLAAAGTVTIDASAGDLHVITLQANVTGIAVTNYVTGQWLTIEWLQDATGGRFYAWPSECRFAGSAPTASTGANRRDSMTFSYEGGYLIEQARSINVQAL